MWNKILLFTIILLLNRNNCLSQIPNISIDQMQQDIDFLVNTIKEVEPNLSIRQQVTGTNLYIELDSLAKKAKDIQTFDDFYFLLKRILFLCQDRHDDLQNFYPSGIEHENKYIKPKNVEISNYCYQRYLGMLPCCGGMMTIRYLNGQYYTIENIYAKQTDELLIPDSSMILSINNIPIDRYVALSRPFDNAVRWDGTRKQYYTHSIYHPFFILGSMEALITYEKNNTVKTVEFKDAYVTGFNLIGNESVQYFEDKKILYIRIPTMDYDKIDFYKTAILNNKEKPVEKIVLDIRNNGGGNDMLWIELLAIIIDKPIMLENKVYYKESPIVVDYVEKIRMEKITKRLKFNDEYYFTSSESPTFFITPDENSINYKGNIYILVNENCYSSSLVLSSICKRVDKLISVGNSTGYIEGRSTTPFFFSMPNSGLIFELCATIDMWAKTPYEHYDVNAEIPVNNTVVDYINEIKYQSTRYSKEFLFNYDPAFKTILDIENNP